MWNGSQLNIKSLQVSRWGLLFFGLFVLSFTVFFSYLPYNVRLKEGQVSLRTIVSPRFIEFESSQDKIKNKTIKRHYQVSVEKIYTVDNAITQECMAAMADAFQELKNARELSKKTPEDLILFLSQPQFDYALRLDVKGFNLLECFAIKCAQDILSEGIQENTPKTVLPMLEKESKNLGLNNAQKEFIYPFVQHFIRPNLAYDPSKTKNKMQQELSHIKQFATTFKEGEPIIYKGDIVTQAHLDALQALSIYGVKVDYSRWLGILIVVVLLALLIERFLFFFNPKLYPQTKYFFLIYSIVMLLVVIGVLLQNMTLVNKAIDVKFLIPISMASMLLSFLVTPNLSLLCGTVISLLIAVAYHMDFSLFIYLFLSNCATGFVTHRKYTRSQLIWAGYIVGLVNVVTVVGLGLVQEYHSWKWYLPNLSIAFLSGMISSMLSLAILPYFESLFKITTKQTLLELSNLNHPLLKRLMTTAPGTYQHSLMVANLAEAGAEAIWADPILTRVGAYFHDIGKIKRPLFFSENQNGENPHEGLQPRMSKMIITSHVEDGLELAEKYKLPPVLRSFISEHHGTTMVSFFYSQARLIEDLPDSDQVKEEFRYPGPKPQFKESGILMLADSVEAAARSIEKPSISKIEKLIDRIFDEKIRDGQLNECGLTLQEIETIKMTFLKILQGIYHSRLDYQEKLSSMIHRYGHKDTH